MSNIKIVFDTKALQLRFENHASSGYCDFIAAIDRYGETVDISCFKYGATISINNQVVIENCYPPDGVQYINTNQDILVTERLSPFPADAECHIVAWVEISETRIEEDITFTIPRPTQPFASWIWNETCWTAPIPYPSDDGIYIWREDEGDWIKSDITK